jgi:hypothetical protein
VVVLESVAAREPVLPSLPMIRGVQEDATIFDFAGRKAIVGAMGRSLCLAIKLLLILDIDGFVHARTVVPF